MLIGEFDLARKFMLVVESRKNPSVRTNIVIFELPVKVDNSSVDVKFIRKMKNEGLITAVIGGKSSIAEVKITSIGQNILNLSRNDSVWEEAQKLASEISESTSAQEIEVFLKQASIRLNQN